MLTQLTETKRVGLEKSFVSIPMLLDELLVEIGLEKVGETYILKDKIRVSHDTSRVSEKDVTLLRVMGEEEYVFYKVLHGKGDLEYMVDKSYSNMVSGYEGKEIKPFIDDVLESIRELWYM